MSEANIHPTAVVAATATLGPDVTVGPYAIIENDVIIGANSTINAHAVVCQYVEMGKNTQVFPHAVIGGLPQDLTFNSKTISYVKMGDNNVFREGVTVNRSTQEGQATLIGSNCYFMNNSHIAHDCVVGDKNILASAVHLAGHVHIGNKIFFGGGAMIHQFCRIGSLSMIRGLAGVTKDIIPYTMAGGFPVLHYRLNTVGIKRSGVDSDRLKILSSAFRLLRNREALDTLERTPEIIELENWLAAESLRGIHRFAGK